MRYPIKKTKSNKILAIIPARGGSKGVKNKNIKLLKGKPLIYYTIEAILKSKLISDFVISTDSAKIVKTCEEIGIEVPFIRPKYLSKDNTESYPVIVHALNKMQDKNKNIYDYFIMLQPTSPLRKSEDIDSSLELLIKSPLDSIVSVVEVGGNHPLRMKKVDNSGMLINYIDQNGENMKPRQELEKVYIRNGCIYASKVDVLSKYNSLVGKSCLPYLMDKKSSINIDNDIDFKMAEEYLI